MDFTIRNAIYQDIDALVCLLSRLFFLERDFTFVPDHCRRGLTLLLETPELGVIKVAESCSQVRGMVTGQLSVSTACGGMSLRVEDMIVDPYARKRGIGKALLQAVSEWGENHGAVRLQLLADITNNDALDFYAHLGWESTFLTALHFSPARVGVPTGEKSL